MNRLIVIMLSMLLINCGGGGGSSSVEGPTTPAGFPVVAGRYAFNTDNVVGSCSDGSNTDSTKLSFNVDVSQTDNALQVQRVDSPVFPGLTILSIQPASGNVNKDGSFVLTQVATARFDNLPGTFTLTYQWEGSFFSSGWAGDYNYRAVSSSLSCDFNTTFSGDKI